MKEVFLAGCGLACALGTDIQSALQTLQAGGVEPQPMQVGPDLAWPYFGIPDTQPDWYARACHLCQQVVLESGIQDRNIPLFIASCSLHIGAFEGGRLPEGDCLQFSELLTQWLNWQGPVYWISTACTSSSNAMLAALSYLRNGHAQEALVLGLELANRYTSAGFGAMQLLDTRRPRPLAADRSGLVLGEAVAALRLSSQPSPWRICGGANVVDGQDPAGANADAVSQMVRQALVDSRLDPDDIKLIKLQAAGSPGNDLVELEGLREIFPALPALVSFKAEIGHTLGASGAAELALLTACMDQGIWPVTRYLTDPALHATFAVGSPTARYVMSNILGFGGGHATVILERCP